MKNYSLSSRCAGCLVIPKRLVNREERGKLIAKTSGAILIINESNYIVKSTSGNNNTYTVIATQSGWTCSCPDYTRHNAKCKHVYAVEFYRRLSPRF